MTFDSLVSALSDTDAMLPLLGSVIAGALIGADREFLGKPAGLRTHALVCFASALMTLLGLRMAEWTVVFPEGTQIVSDMARMPHAILTGIGFLGAGVIFRSGISVHGLTTAASLWLTASLGIVFGAGLLELATISTAIALVVLVFQRTLRRISPPQPVVRIKVAVNAESSYDAARLASLLAAQGLRATSPSIEHERATGLRRYTLLGSAYKQDINAESLARAIREDAAVQELSIIPLENEIG
ncbi:MgtC/SapB family protein [Paracoccus benzoatiresistens]|uniref:Protein MgtC n=1 Tax=Paracoccus benzoatiresistens TaxID=2997341 RepID=A0ABT4J6Y8_9RHOB|nr:MgtC/SapB family protein [Paracoccus sp. EF6]MCZ0962664.1 MgtC/SapB family protein [Paracoccus sp. EF6]